MNLRTARGLQDQRNCYVQITRARDEVKIYTDSRETLRELAGVLRVKADTLDLDASLSEAVAIEQSVRKRALEPAEENSGSRESIKTIERQNDSDSRVRSRLDFSRDL